MSFTSTKVLELGSCAFRQPKAESHCRFLHGYRLTAKFWFSANQLDENNWVVDFGSLSHLKERLKKQFDHTTVLDKDDPYIDEFTHLEEEGIIDKVEVFEHENNSAIYTENISTTMSFVNHTEQDNG